MIINKDVPEIVKTIVGFLHILFYGLNMMGIILTEAIFKVTNYSLFNQEFVGLEAQMIMGIISVAGIISGIMILKSIRGGGYTALGVGVFLVIGIITNF